MKLFTNGIVRLNRIGPTAAGAAEAQPFTTASKHILTTSTPDTCISGVPSKTCDWMGYNSKTHVSRNLALFNCTFSKQIHHRTKDIDNIS